MDDRIEEAPFARLAIEVEWAHRGVMIVRQLGSLAMNSPYNRLFLAVRIWRKNDNGCFGGAAVLWGKDEDSIISVLKAVDFGTRELTASAKSSFELDDDDSMMPRRVESWTRLAPISGHGDLRSKLDAVDIASRRSSSNPTRTGSCYFRRLNSFTRHRRRRQQRRFPVFSACLPCKQLTIAAMTCICSLQDLYMLIMKGVCVFTGSAVG
jgi:hypothetical protein